MTNPATGSAAAAGERPRAPYASYASDPAATRGRIHTEPPSPTRNVFQRDRDRILHSAAFRRLKDKTQVFVYDEGDHFRTRLTHTIEVAQIARALARALRLDEDLTEALALAHDLGHPPFGHAGERALDGCMAPYGGFDHNAQALRVVTKLERSYASYDGLNLTWEMLEGLVKHNGPLLDAGGVPLPGHSADTCAMIVQDAAPWNLDLSRFSSLEAQAAALADDIAYDAHDVDDGLRATLFTLDDCRASAVLRPLVDDVRARYAGASAARQRAEVARRVITFFIEDAIEASRLRLKPFNSASVEAVRAHHETLISFSAAMAEREKELKRFLAQHMYAHERVARVMAKAQGVVTTLFEIYMNDAAQLPPDWRHGQGVAGARDHARVVCDFIAGMTDRFALQDLARLTGEAVELR